jgi:hypothetical protein
LHHLNGQVLPDAPQPWPRGIKAAIYGHVQRHRNFDEMILYKLYISYISEGNVNQWQC